MARPPRWIQELADSVAGLIVPCGPPMPMGCHFYHVQTPKDQWELTLFTARAEVIGGPSDGAVISTPIALNLEKLPQLFDKVESYHWQTLRLGQEDELGPHVSVVGYYQGHYVWLRVLAEAPERFGTSANLFIRGRQVVIEEIW